MLSRVLIGLVGLIMIVAAVHLLQGEADLAPPHALPQVGNGTADANAATSASIDVHALKPASLARGGVRRLALSVTYRGDEPDPLVEVTLSISPNDLRPGAVWIQPRRLLVRSAELGSTRIEIGTLPTVGCDADTGELTIGVRALGDADSTVEVLRRLPGIDCRPGPAPAPAATHVTQPVCGSLWREDLQRIIDGERPRRSRCHQPPETWDRPAGRPADRPEPQAEEPYPPDEPPEEAAEENGEQADPREERPPAEEQVPRDTGREQAEPEVPAPDAEEEPAAPEEPDDEDIGPADGQDRARDSARPGAKQPTD